jgi:hypothetical protein
MSLDKLNIETLDEKYVKKYNTYIRNYKVNFTQTPNNYLSTIELLHDTITEVLNKFKEKADGDDKLKLYINHPELSHPISIPFLDKDALTVEMVVNQISKVLQSNKKLEFDDKITFTTSLIKIPKGSGRVDDFIVKKSSIVQVRDENDQLCGLRAIVIAKALADNDMVLYNKIRDKRNNLQTLEALKLASKIGLSPDKPIGLKEISVIQSYLDDYRIIVIDSSMLNSIVYNEYVHRTKKIILYIHNNHFYVVKSLPAFYCKKYWCDKCMQSYNKFNFHKCNNVCPKCLDRHCTNTYTGLVLHCKSKRCLVMCFSESCFNGHIEKGCYEYEKCKVCGERSSRKGHKCDGKYCKFCKEYVAKDHKCYIKKSNISSNKELFNSYIFFDYEAMSVNGDHIPNLVVAQKICKNCLQNEICEEECGEFVFYNNDDFCKWLFRHRAIAIAHNMKAYDGYFVLQNIVKNIRPGDKPPEILLSGSKVLVIKFAQVKIIDSINFLPMSLSKLPKTFGIKELKKGYFPHFFNLKDNQGYIGKYPDPVYYGVEYMTKPDLDNFYKWYETKNDETFDFQKELLSYCQSDVEILKKSCLLFRDIFMSITKINNEDSGIDPFESCLTIASACHLVYRRNFMPENSIALIPEFGYQKSDNNSHKALIWLKYISVSENVYIEHAKNGREKYIGKYKVDGWSQSTDTAYEFHGCVFHGCNKCYSSETFNTILNETMGRTYLRHLERMTYLKNKVNVVEIWECEYEAKLKTDYFFKSFVKSIRNIRPPLNPRSALAGGRTNAIELYYSGRAGYIDFTSLYPYIQKYGVFPLGHPKIITENFKSLDNYFGLVYCRVLPPQKLYLPVLPYKSNNKLMFPLCATCADTLCDTCNHLPHERELEGTWVILEVLKAIEKGYQVTQIYEVWDFEKTSTYDKEQEGGLFTKYVNTFLKIKQEAAGFPKWVISEEDKRNYIKNFYEKEKVLLDYDSIKENNGLKSIAKLMLNSQWGRYAMNTQKTQSKFITEPIELLKLFQDDRFEVKDLIFPSDALGIVFYENKAEMNWGSNQTNVVIASFVTCQARLKLYSELEKLDRRVLYFDTDSIIYKKDSTSYEPEIGDFLGEFTNEIDPSEGNEIVEFVSAGPKNYAYRLDTGISHCKVKGFSLNYEASKLIDFDKIKQIVSKDRELKEHVKQNTIVRNKKDWSLKTKNNLKVYQLVYDKRIILSDLTTIPYGYKP